MTVIFPRLKSLWKTSEITNWFIANNIESYDETKTTQAIPWYNELGKIIGKKALKVFTDDIVGHQQEIHSDDSINAVLDQIPWDFNSDDIGYGNLSVDGQDIGVYPSDYRVEYSDDEIVKSYHIADSDFNLARLLYDLNLEDPNAPGAGLVNLVTAGKRYFHVWTQCILMWTLSRRTAYSVLLSKCLILHGITCKRNRGKVNMILITILQLRLMINI